MAGIVKVNVKWGKQKWDDVELDTSESPLAFKAQVFALTGVPPERQKFMGIRGLKGGQLPDEGKWSDLAVKKGMTIMVMGAADQVAKPTEKVVFEEDLTSQQLDQLEASNYPNGLVNLGNTCYMNSTLQCLRVVPELQRVLRGYSANRVGGSAGGGNADRNVTVALRDLLVMLDDSKSPMPPLVFLQEFRTAHPQFAQRGRTGQFAQQDAEEAWSQLLLSVGHNLSRLPVDEASPLKEEEALQTNLENAVEQLFGGTLQVTLKCAESEEEAPTMSTEKFLRLSCHISDKVGHMHEGIRLSLEEVLEKQSPSLSRNARYTKTSRVSRLPPYLMVQFVRFHWRADTQVRAKILRKVAFPFKLDMFEFCTDELKDRLLVQRRALVEAENTRIADQAAGKSTTTSARSRSSSRDRGKGKGAARDGKGGKDGDKDKDNPLAIQYARPGQAVAVAQASEVKVRSNNNGYYQLAGIVSHQGRTADSGHYVSWIRVGDDKWLKFDDDKVSECKDDHIKALSGGADSHIAYMALYRYIDQ